MDQNGISNGIKILSLRGANNDYLISLLVNFPCEMGQIMNRYDFLEGR